MKELPRASSRNKREQLETSSWFAVVRAYLECSKRYTEMLQHFELTVAQYDVLNAIESLGSDAVPKAIADRLVVTRANITGLLRRLEERKLVKMTAHQADGRSVVCALTRKGKTLHDRARDAAGRFVRAQLQPFEDSDLKYTEQMMRSMHAHLQTLDPDALAAPDSHKAAS